MLKVVVVVLAQDCVLVLVVDLAPVVAETVLEAAALTVVPLVAVLAADVQVLAVLLVEEVAPRPAEAIALADVIVPARLLVEFLVRLPAADVAVARIRVEQTALDVLVAAALVRADAKVVQEIAKAVAPEDVLEAAKARVELVAMDVTVVPDAHLPARDVLDAQVRVRVRAHLLVTVGALLPAGHTHAKADAQLAVGLLDVADVMESVLQLVAHHVALRVVVTVDHRVVLHVRLVLVALVVTLVVAADV